MSQLIGQRLWFPDPQSADPDGLVAVGGDLSPERLLLAYRQGLFPWTARPVTWWSPDPRTILPLDQLHISSSLKKVLRREPFEIRKNQAFRQVIAACAEPGPNRPGVWITTEFIEAYCQLHAVGQALSSAAVSPTSSFCKAACSCLKLPNSADRSSPEVIPS